MMAEPTEAGPGPLARHFDLVKRLDPIRVEGRVAQIVGLVVESDGPAARMGEVCLITGDPNLPPIAAEVVGFRGDRLLLMPLGEMTGVMPGPLFGVSIRVSFEPFVPT